MGLRSRGEEEGRGNPFFLWVFGPGVPILFCLHFSYCYLPVSNLYLADGFYSFFLQFCLSYCSQGAHSRIFLFYPSFLFRLLGVEVYFWFWLTRVCFSVGFSRLSGIYFLVGFSRLSACLEHTIYRWCPSGFTHHSFSSKRSEFLEYTSFLCFCLSSYFLVENKIKATFSLISVGRSIKGRLKSSVGMSRVPILFLMRCVGSYHAADDTM